MKKILGTVAILVACFVGGCKDEGQLVPQTAVDPRLVGDWYHLDTLRRGYPSPLIRLRAMRINADQTIQALGIEVATGKLTINETEAPKQILHANGGLLEFQYFAPPDRDTASRQYSFGNNTLILSDEFFSEVYQRSGIGASIVPPEQATMSVSIDSSLVQSPLVSAVVPVYVSRTQTSPLRLTAEIPGGLIAITIDDFRGIGRYTIAKGKGELYLFSGDAVMFLTTDSLATDSIDIDEYDEAAGRCSGGFAFTARNASPPGNSAIVCRLTGGSFSAPLYR